MSPGQIADCTAFPFVERDHAELLRGPHADAGTYEATFDSSVKQRIETDSMGLKEAINYQLPGAFIAGEVRRSLAVTN